jgi:hypothetical protein
MQIIPSHFNGTAYRSRTEARWAVFFDQLGIKVIYEPEGYILEGKAYLPDFFIPDWPAYMEIKGQNPSPVEVNKCNLLARETGVPVLLMVGDPAFLTGRLSLPSVGYDAAWQDNMTIEKCRDCGQVGLTMHTPFGVDFHSFGRCGCQSVSIPLIDQASFARNFRFGRVA